MPHGSNGAGAEGSPGLVHVATRPDTKRRSDRPDALLLRVSDLTSRQRAEMFALLSDHYDFVTPKRFESDLDEKDSVVVRISGGRIVGFSTLLRFRTEIDGEPVMAFYSGDTVVDPEHRGRRLTGAFAVFLQYLFEPSAADASVRRYYLHVAGTWRGYLMVPALFRVSHPRYDRSLTVDHSRILVALARARGLDYDSGRSIVRFVRPSVLKEGHDPLSRGVVADPHVQFFINQNSGHVRGERLASLVEVTVQNLTPVARRLLAVHSGYPAA